MSQISRSMMEKIFERDRENLGFTPTMHSADGNIFHYNNREHICCEVNLKENSFKLRHSLPCLMSLNMAECSPFSDDRHFNRRYQDMLNTVLILKSHTRII